MSARPSTALASPDAAAAAAAPAERAEAPAFDAVFASLGPYVVRVVRRMGVNAADVDDVTQEVFLAVHRGLPTFAGRSSVRTWVYGICIRTCSNHRDRAFRRREQLVLDPERLEDARDPERQLEGQHALAALDRALAELPHAQRAVFVLFEIEGLDMREVAVATGASKFTAYARLYAARKRVSAALAPHGPGEPP